MMNKLREKIADYVEGILGAVTLMVVMRELKKCNHADMEELGRKLDGLMEAANMLRPATIDLLEEKLKEEFPEWRAK